MNPFDLSYLPEALKDTTLFIMACGWAAGYLARLCPIVPVSYRPLIVWSITTSVCIMTVDPLIRGLGLGLIYTCLAIVSYDQVFSRIEDFVNVKITINKMKESTNEPEK